MKLKKIVSLAAAALMAVSMLTACGEGTTNEPTTDDSSSTNSMNASSVVYNAMDKNARDHSVAVANAKLDASLAKNVGIYSNLDDLFAYLDGVDHALSAKPVDVSKNTYIWRQLAFDMGITDTDEASSIAALDGSEENVTNSKTAVRLYVTNFTVSDQYALEYVGKLIDKELAACHNVSANRGVEYTYEVSASIVSQQFSNTGLDTDVSALKFIAVSVTRTSKQVSVNLPNVEPKSV